MYTYTILPWWYHWHCHNTNLFILTSVDNFIPFADDKAITGLSSDDGLMLTNVNGIPSLGIPVDGIPRFIIYVSTYMRAYIFYLIIEDWKVYKKSLLSPATQTEALKEAMWQKWSKRMKPREATFERIIFKHT